VTGGAPPSNTGGGLFVPRTAGGSRPRAGIGARSRGIQAPVPSNGSGNTRVTAKLASGKSQDEFRKMLG
jgi:hypothetical protein